MYIYSAGMNYIPKYFVANQDFSCTLFSKNEQQSKKAVYNSRNIKFILQKAKKLVTTSNENGNNCIYVWYAIVWTSNL
jgi:hypothetical protein